MTGEADRQRLLALARAAVVAHVMGAAPPEDAAGSDALARHAGAFVTLHSKGELRGCIGHVGADRALGRVVAECAVAACSEDPRFPPVALPELPDLQIEVSILGAFEPIESPDAVVVGRHGLVAERGWRRGLLLPQVATEHGWDARTFAEHTCQKAGLPRDAWQHGATLRRFEAEVFGDE